MFHSGIQRADVLALLAHRGCRLYFAGIGGSGMYPLAMLCDHLGYAVSGCDRVEGANTQALRQNGIWVDVPAPAGAVQAELLVYSLALPAGDPILRFAKVRGIPAVSRAELLGALMGRYRHRIGVMGTHGKSTVTAMLSRIFTFAGKHPTVVSGAPLAEEGLPYRLGGEEVLIYEACEYRDSFLHFDPTLTVLLVVEQDHTDYFESREALVASFVGAMQREGNRVLSFQSQNNALILKNITVPVATFGPKNADFSYKMTRNLYGYAEFELHWQENKVSTVRLNVPGEFQMQNATAALGAALWFGLDPEVCVSAVETFFGIPRRMSRIGSHRGVPLFYDYAHHPTAIGATLEALRQMCGSLTVVFCPHTYSRTAAFFSDFARVLAMAEQVFILPIDGAREEPVAGISASALAAAVPGAVALQAEQVPQMLSEVHTGAIVLMGAGNFGDLPAQLVKKSDA